MRFSEETRRKMSEAAKKRWAKMSEEERELRAENQSELMKLKWLLMTPEERRAQARLASESRKRNKGKKDGS